MKKFEKLKLKKSNTNGNGSTIFDLKKLILLITKSMIQFN